MLFTCRAGCDQDMVLEELRRLGLWPDRTERPRHSKGEPLAIYNYRDEDAKLLFQVCGFAQKQCLQRRPDGIGGWIWRLDDTRRIPYRLTELAIATRKRNGTAPRVYICDGEKESIASPNGVSSPLRILAVPANGARNSPPT